MLLMGSVGAHPIIILRRCRLDAEAANSAGQAVGSIGSAVGQAATGAITLAQAGIAEGLQQLANAVVSGRRRQLLAALAPDTVAAGAPGDARIKGSSGVARLLGQQRPLRPPQPETVADRVRSAIAAGGAGVQPSAGDTASDVVSTVLGALG